MKIKMTVTAASGTFMLKKDKEYTVTPELGKSLIRAGQAIELDEPLENAMQKQVLETRTVTPKKDVSTPGRRRTRKAGK